MGKKRASRNAEPYAAAAPAAPIRRARSTSSVCCSVACAALRHPSSENVKYLRLRPCFHQRGTDTQNERVSERWFWLATARVLPPPRVRHAREVRPAERDERPAFASVAHRRNHGGRQHAHRRRRRVVWVQQARSGVHVRLVLQGRGDQIVFFLFFCFFCVPSQGVLGMPRRAPAAGGSPRWRRRAARRGGGASRRRAVEARRATSTQCRHPPATRSHTIISDK